MMSKIRSTCEQAEQKINTLANSEFNDSLKEAGRFFRDISGFTEKPKLSTKEETLNIDRDRYISKSRPELSSKPNIFSTVDSSSKEKQEYKDIREKESASNNKPRFITKAATGLGSELPQPRQSNYTNGMDRKPKTPYKMGNLFDDIGYVAPYPRPQYRDHAQFSTLSKTSTTGFMNSVFRPHPSGMPMSTEGRRVQSPIASAHLSTTNNPFLDIEKKMAAYDIRNLPRHRQPMNTADSLNWFKQKGDTYSTPIRTEILLDPKYQGIYESHTPTIDNLRHFRDKVRGLYDKRPRSGSNMPRAY